MITGVTGGASRTSAGKRDLCSVICSPLIYGGEAIGALMIVAGRLRTSVRARRCLSPATLGAGIGRHCPSRLFAGKVELNRQVEFARSQLETVLVSTESPVIAVDRRFKLIFANPAARVLFAQTTDAEATPVHRLFPPHAFPSDYRQALREIKRNRAFSYEVVVRDRIYLCHAAPLGKAPDHRLGGGVERHYSA
jgi:PAS domain-containing protein